ncbi:hypothetical protein [Curtobacterium sp. MCSS17_005]|uniref:hypothetical protein n=1 Tax=Curtobacterium sp. MCSS17_005 TaxID=2175641 RepID=UPI000DA6DEB1|nr:hypothetical protein [Curtobacterium sp. MCSS17_005]WIB34359.1 hypothetical protein DEJ20_07800 [Curtobacterium sp. MCSS17_005]
MHPLLRTTGARLASGLALVVVAAIAWFVRVPRTVVATITAFGAGGLISALSFDLVAEATRSGTFWTAMAGFLGGAVVYVGLDVLLERRGARKKRSEAGSPGSGTGLGMRVMAFVWPLTMLLGGVVWLVFYLRRGGRRRPATDGGRAPRSTRATAGPGTPSAT